MSKFNVVFGDSSFKDTFGWVKLGSKSFAKRPFLHFLTLFSITIWLLAIVILGGFFQLDYIGLMIMSAIFSTILPLAMASMVITDDITTSGQSGNPFKIIVSRLWKSGVLRLIVVFVLIGVALSLAESLVIQEFPNSAQILNIVVQFIQIVLQLIGWIAIPAALRNERVMPFHMLWYSFVAICKNFIPVILYSVLNLIILFLVIAACFGLMAALSQTVVGIIFVFLMMIFLSWFGICCAYVSRQILPSVERI